MEVQGPGPRHGALQHPGAGCAGGASGSKNGLRGISSGVSRGLLSVLAMAGPDFPPAVFFPLVMDAARRVGLSLVLGRSHPSLGRCLSVCKACVPPI